MLARLAHCAVDDPPVASPASFRADPYAAVSAGLGAMAGTWYGAASRRVEEALAAIGGKRPAGHVVDRLPQEPHMAPGFGHPLYPHGDPRVPLPNVDLALAALMRALRLTPGAGEALFTIGRLAGWLAHAIEEYAHATPFRQRAVYTGPRPK